VSCSRQPGACDTAQAGIHRRIGVRARPLRSITWRFTREGIGVTARRRVRARFACVRLRANEVKRRRQYGCIDHWIAEHVLDTPWLSEKRTAPAMRPTMKDEVFELLSPSKVAAPEDDEPSVTWTSRGTPISPTSIAVPLMVPVTPYPVTAVPLGRRCSSMVPKLSADRATQLPFSEVRSTTVFTEVPSRGWPAGAHGGNDGSDEMANPESVRS